ncbi:ABC transporter permease, partial [Methanocaldococcus sp.]
FLVMNLVGVIMVYRKIKLKNRVKFFLSLLITFFSTSSIILSLLILTKVITPKPIEVIPLMGMIVGNCLNTIHLCLDKLQDMVKKDKDQIFGMLALGATEWIAIKYSLVNAIRSSIIPILNKTKSVGIIFIPGAMVGLLIAGANPIYAAKIQVVIMWMILSSSLISTSIISILIYKEFLKF